MTVRADRRAILAVAVVAAVLVLIGTRAAPAGAEELLLRVGDAEVPAGTIVSGDAIVIGGTLDIGGMVTRNAVAAGGSVHVSGHVGGDVRAFGGNVDLDSTAVVDGTVRSEGGSVHIAPGAVIRRAPPGQSAPSAPQTPFPFPPSTNPFPSPSPPPGAPWMPPAVFGIIMMWKLLAGLAVLLALTTFVGTAWLTAVFFPRVTTAVAGVLERSPGAAALAGVLIWLLIGPVIVLLVLSVAGILLVLLLFAALLIAIQVGISAVAVLVGHRVRPGRLAVEALIGAVLLAVAFAVPHLGWLAGLAATTWGAGGVAVAIVEGRRGQGSVPPPAPTSAPPSMSVPPQAGPLSSGMPAPPSPPVQPQSPQS